MRVDCSKIGIAGIAAAVLRWAEGDGAEAARCFERMPNLADPERNALRQLALARALGADPAQEEQALARLRDVLRVAADARTRRHAYLAMARILEGPSDVIRDGGRYGAAVALLRRYLDETPFGDDEVEVMIVRLERKRASPLARASEMLSLEESLLNMRGPGGGAR